MSLKDCKTLEKEAKMLEKDELAKAVEKYKETAACYMKNEKPKNGNACLETIGKLYRDNAKSIENPDEALIIYKKSSDFYNKAGKSAEAEKVLKEADLKFIETAKGLRLEAKNIENPREALEISKRAVTNFRKASNKELEEKTWLDAALKFNKIGEETEKSKKNMVLAIDKYLQAKKLYGESKNIDKSKNLDEKVKNLCDFIGLPLDLIVKHLETKNINAIDLI